MASLDRDVVNAKKRAWTKANPDKVRAYKKRDYAKHKDQIKAKAKAWREENRERYNDYVVAWNAANPEKKAETQRRRYVRKRTNGVYLVTDRDWRRLCARHENRCAYCHKSAPLERDHVVPIDRGGQHAIGNLLPACRLCNASKGARVLTEWRAA